MVPSFFVIGMTADEPVRLQLREELIESMTKTMGHELVIGQHWPINHEWKTRGGLPPVLEALREGARQARALEASHVVLLCEDMKLHPAFFSALAAVAVKRPGAIVDCQINHPGAEGMDGVGYETYEGATLLGGMMRLRDLEAFLAWEDAHDKVFDTLKGLPIDARVNLWAMDTGRAIFKPLPALIDHDLLVPSLQGNQWQTETGAAIRHSIGFDPAQPWPVERDFGERVPCLGRTYENNALELLTHLPVTGGRVERYFDVMRGHGRTGKTSLFIAAPAYRGEIKSDWMVSVMGEMEILREANVDVSLVFKADSLINRARNRLVAEFLASECSHLIMWDTDNFPTRPGAVKAMLETGHDVVGGAIVLKDGENDKFAMQWIRGGVQKLEAVNGCIEVAALGTAFFMVSRRAILKMIQSRPQDLYFAGKWMEAPGRPEWHLFADAVRDRHHLSEDYEFCARWRDIGGKVYLRYDLDFIHLGEYPFTGSFAKRYKLEEAEG